MDAFLTLFKGWAENPSARISALPFVMVVLPLGFYSFWRYLARLFVLSRELKVLIGGDKAAQAKPPEQRRAPSWELVLQHTLRASCKGYSEILHDHFIVQEGKLQLQRSQGNSKRGYCLSTSFASGTTQRGAKGFYNVYVSESSAV